MASHRLLARGLCIVALLQPALPLAAQGTNPPTPFQASQARTILTRQLSCLGCHQLDGEGGRIGPSLSDVARRRSSAYIRAIIADPQAVVPGSVMPKAEMPSAVRDLIVRYLATGASIEAGTVPRAEPARTGATRPADRADGATLYAKWCAACHGQSGDGRGPNAAYLPIRPAAHSSAREMSPRSDDALFDVVAAGGAVAGKSPRMPAFGATLTPAEIRALVAYIRVLCACAGPEWSRDGSNR